MLLIFLYSLLPIRTWGKFLFPTQIEVITIATCIAVVILWDLQKKLLSSEINIEISRIDFTVILMALYAGCRYLFQCHTFYHEYFFESFVLIIAYVFFRGAKQNQTRYFLYLVPLAAIAQIAYGIKYQTWFFAPGYGLKDITGLFFNPGLLGGFIAISAVIPLGLLTDNGWPKYSTPGNILQKLRGIFFLIVFIILLVQLFGSNSRAALIAFFAGLIYFIGYKNNCYRLFRTLSWFKKLFFTAVLVCLIAVSFVGLYKLRETSADGRLLIWRNAFEMIKDKPLWGHGLDGFQAKYMEYQAGYFQNRPGSGMGMLADDNHYAFNEFLKIWVELGTVGLLLTAYILYQVFFRLGQDKNIEDTPGLLIARSALLSFFVFCCFSYPLAVFQFKLLLIFLLATVSVNSRFSRNNWFKIPFNLKNTGAKLIYTIKLVVVTIVLIGSFVILCSLYRYSSSCWKWDAALKGYTKKNGEETVGKMEAVYPVLRNNGVFLSTYGKVLYTSGHFDKAILVFQEANQYLSSLSNYIELGKSHQALENFEEARNAWDKASDMVPSRFTPHYLKSKMLFENGSVREARAIARELLAKEVKLWTPELQYLKDDLAEMLSTKK